MIEPRPKAKPFAISKEEVRRAYLRVKANKGAAGVDGASIEEFERDLDGNLYKLWNRMASGSYHPPPVRAVDVPKKGGQDSRTLGVPTVADRIAQTVAKMRLEPEVEPIFHPDSYAYRPGRSAHDALGTCRKRCWRTNWVLDLDIESFFDTIDHDLVLQLVCRHTDCRWILLYVERWLNAPLQREDGTLLQRDRGTPQGSAISPLLANVFLHYAFDSWMAEEFPHIRFERYSDDVIVHCASERQARFVRDRIAQRLAGWRLRLNRAKTRIVYCKDADRPGSHEHERFDFLGYTFRPRLSRSKFGKHFVNFTPGVSDGAAKGMRQQIRRWRLHDRSDKTLEDLARMFNPIVQGWINYYGRFYRSELYSVLRPINDRLVRWAQRKFKRLRRHPSRARRFLANVARREPGLFAHWRMGLLPDGWAMGARCAERCTPGSARARG
jgi:RNA-directed DNA polymerase